MKKPLVFIVLSIFLLSLLAACAPVEVSTSTSSVEEPSVEEAATPIETPAPLPTSTATPTPEPIDCDIVFDTNRDGNREIYRMAPDGSNLLNLTNNPAEDFMPVWSPDGSQIAFISNRPNEGEGGQFIYIMNADGSDVRQLNSESDSNWPDWSNDGSLITFTHHGDIHIIKADGSSPAVNLTSSPEYDGQPKISPDGRMIAWQKDEGGMYNIYVMNIDGSNVVQITNSGQDGGPRWTVDGRLFVMWGWSDRERTCQNCLVNADGTGIEDAGGKGDLQRYFPFYTVNGERVEVADGDFINGNPEIFLAGSIFPDFFLNLTNNPAEDRFADWPVNCLLGR